MNKTPAAAAASFSSLKEDDDDGQKKSDDVVSAETSLRVCRHVNEDHAVTVYAMAKGILNKDSTSITQAKLAGVNDQECRLQVVTCSGDVCERQTLHYPWRLGPLTHSSQLRNRFAALHQQVCAPRLDWMVNKPLCLVIVPAVTFLAYGSTATGSAWLQETLSKYDEFIPPAMAGAFCSMTIPACWWFTCVAHAGEAIWAGHHCRTHLKLHWRATLLWVLLIAAVGYPVLTELSELLAIYKQQEEKKQKKKASSSKNK